MAVVVAVAVFGIAAVWAVRRAGAGPSVPVLAVGAVRDYRARDTSTIARALPNLLATNLARVPGLRVVSNTRMYEILGQLADARDTGGVMARAAREAGAGELVEGEFYGVALDSLRLDLRRVSLATGEVGSAGWRSEASLRLPGNGAAGAPRTCVRRIPGWPPGDTRHAVPPRPGGKRHRRGLPSSGSNSRCR